MGYRRDIMKKHQKFALFPFCFALLTISIKEQWRTLLDKTDREWIKNIPAQTSQPPENP